MAADGLHVAVVVVLAAILRSASPGAASYDPGWARGLEGYGKTWMYLPDGQGVPRVALLASDERSTPSIPEEVGPDEVIFYLYTRNQEMSEVIDADDPTSLWQSSFNPDRPTRFVVHGWKSSADADIVQIVKNAYLEKEDCNVIGVDWSNLASSNFYPWAKSYTNPVGKRVSSLIKMMVGERKWAKDQNPNDKKKGKKKKKKKSAGQHKIDKGMAKLSDIHLIGHSLGAHLMGYAGQHLKPHKIGRITGLDPAMPLFEILPSRDGHLDATDADFVDVIHTCAGAVGFLDNIGHVDFYPNGGVPMQPGCCCAAEFAEACSHGRSYQLYAESIKSQDFVGVECDSWENFQNGSCDSGATAIMGHHVSTSSRGVFYLLTNQAPPYAMGEKGLRPA